MTINAIDRSLVTSIAAPAAPATPSASSAPSAVSAPIASADPRPRISGPGQLLGKLQQLAQQDPAKFKQVTQHIADEIRKTAGASSGKAADLANDLADRFSAAAESGDLSAFKPAAPQAGADGAKAAHHHHRHGGGADGDGGPLATIFASALDEVNQALGASASGGGDATSAPDAAPVTDTPSAT